jgi:hypothetical protein
MLTAETYGLGPDTEAETTYLQAYRTPSLKDPERRLMVAILEDAIFSLPQGSRPVKEEHRHKSETQTQQWFLSTNTDHPLSFVNVCGELGLEPSAVLRQLRGPDGLQTPLHMQRGKGRFRGSRRL